MNETDGTLSFEWFSLDYIMFLKSEVYPDAKSHHRFDASMNKEEMTMLTNMRSNCIKGIKANFKNMHKLCLHCPLKCDTENPQEDTQEHILVCSRLDGSNMDLELIHASSVEQSELARQFCGLMNQRTTLLEEQSDSSSCCRPGANLDPSSLGAAAADAIL